MSERSGKSDFREYVRRGRGVNRVIVDFVFSDFLDLSQGFVAGGRGGLREEEEVRVVLVRCRGYIYQRGDVCPRFFTLLVIMEISQSGVWED